MALSKVDYSPIRSGLRKRKRAESPVHAEPRVEEQWIDEDHLELWEIKAYRDKIERERTAAITRRQAGREIKAPDRLDPSEEVKERTKKRVVGDGSDIKAQMEENLRQQREAFKAGHSGEGGGVKPSLTGLGVRKSGDGIKVVAGRQVTTAGGAVALAQKTLVPGQQGSFAKKVFMTKDGKVIGHQLAPPGKVAIPPTPASPGQAGQANQQKVQIVKSADGKIQVRGLLPGQQLVQMPDGKLQIFSQSGGAKIPTPGKMVAAAPAVVKQPATTQQQLLPKPAQPTTSSPLGAGNKFAQQYSEQLLV